MVLRHLGLQRSLWPGSETIFDAKSHFQALPQCQLQSQAGASPAVSSQAVCCQDLRVFFFTEIHLLSTVNSSRHLDFHQRHPCPTVQSFHLQVAGFSAFFPPSLISYLWLEGLGVAAKSGPPLPQGRGNFSWLFLNHLHLDCSNLKAARLISNFDGPAPSNTDRTLNNPSQHVDYVDTDESCTHMEGAPGLSGNLQTLPGQA